MAFKRLKINVIFTSHWHENNDNVMRRMHSENAYCASDRSRAAVSADCCWQDSVLSTLLDVQL